MGKGFMVRANAWLMGVQMALGFAHDAGLLPNPPQPRTSSEIKEDIGSVKANIAWYEKNKANDPLFISQSAINKQNAKLQALEKELITAEARENEYDKTHTPNGAEIY